MPNESLIQAFEGVNVRIVWDEKEEKYYFSIVDIVRVLTGSENPHTYWRVLKKRLRDEGNETVTNCNALRLPAADGKRRMTDVADMEQLLRLIQSIPSKKAEPLKQWLAEVGSQRIDQMIDPELTFQMAVEDYRRMGTFGRERAEGFCYTDQHPHQSVEWHDNRGVQAFQRSDQRESSRQYDQS